MTVKAKWIGDQAVLPLDSPVTVLATDPECPDGRGAAWIRWWPEGSDYPRYRSCDLADLEIPEDADMETIRKSDPDVRADRAEQKVAILRETLKMVRALDGYDNIGGYWPEIDAALQATCDNS